MKNLDSILPVSDEALYPISVVSKLSNVNPVTLRAWERRYNLFKPKRSSKGHRLYSDKDIRRVHQVLALLEKGVSIGNVAKALKTKQIDTNPKNLAPITSLSNELEELTKEQWDNYQKNLLSNITYYDVLQLERFHHGLFTLYSAESVSNYLIIPVIHKLKDRGQQYSSRSGEYSFYKEFILNWVGALFINTVVKNEGKKILLAGLDGEYCDIKLLLFVLPLLNSGYQIINLGCNIPLDVLPESLSSSEAEAVLFFRGNKSLDKTDINDFKNTFKNKNKPIFITGSSSTQLDLNDSNLIVLPSDSQKQITIIDKVLN